MASCTSSHTPVRHQHHRPAAQDERKRKNGALAKDSSHQACQTLTLPLLEKVSCARCFKEKPYSTSLRRFDQMIKLTLRPLPLPLSSLLELHSPRNFQRSAPEVERPAFEVRCNSSHPHQLPTMWWPVYAALRDEHYPKKDFRPRNRKRASILCT